MMRARTMLGARWAMRAVPAIWVATSPAPRPALPREAKRAVSSAAKMMKPTAKRRVPRTMTMPSRSRAAKRVRVREMTNPERPQTAPMRPNSEKDAPTTVVIQVGPRPLTAGMPMAVMRNMRKMTESRVGWPRM